MRFFVALCLTTFSAATSGGDYYTEWDSDVEDVPMPADLPHDLPYGDGELEPDIDELQPDNEYPAMSSQFTESSTTSTNAPYHSKASETTPITTSKSAVADGETIVDYFSRHVDEVANINARLSSVERIVSLQADLIAMNKWSTELAKDYLLWDASVSSKNETLRAIGYFVGVLVQDSRDDLDQAKADYSTALDEYEKCTNLSGPQWKSVCETLAWTLAKANETLRRVEARTRSREDKLRIINQQKAVLDSVDATPAQEVMSNFRRQQSEVEEEHAKAVSHQMPEWNTRATGFENALDELLRRVESLKFVKIAEDSTTETPSPEITPTTPAPDVENA